MSTRSCLTRLMKKAEGRAVNEGGESVGGMPARRSGMGRLMGVDTQHRNRRRIHVHVQHARQRKKKKRKRELSRLNGVCYVYGTTHRMQAPETAGGSPIKRMGLGPAAGHDPWPVAGASGGSWRDGWTGVCPGRELGLAGLRFSRRARAGACATARALRLGAPPPGSSHRPALPMKRRLPDGWWSR